MSRLSPKIVLSPTVERGASKSLTPARKHHKLLKDGSGNEVWPREVEVIFAQGLREYMKNPDSVKPGRQKWRNGFLVDFLKDRGVVRSKKQVASHIQVLRNMWKGTPYFYLVAGPDELWMECDHEPTLPPQADNFFYKSHTRHSEIKAELSEAISFDLDDSDASSCNSPIFSDGSHCSSSPGSAYSVSLYPASPPPRDTRPLPGPSTFLQLGSHEPNSYPCYPQSNSRQTAASPVYDGRPQYSMTGGPSYAKARADLYSDSNRVTKLELLADFMPAFLVDTDSLPTGLPVCLDIQLSIPAIDDTRCPSTIHGYSAKICLRRVWAKAGWCVTRLVSEGGASEESQQLQITNIAIGIPNVTLPESNLNRCRWLPHETKYTLVQDVWVDGKLLLHVTYHLDRRPASLLPSATLLACRSGQPYAYYTNQLNGVPPFQSTETMYHVPPPVSHQTSLSTAFSATSPPFQTY